MSSRISNLYRDRWHIYWDVNEPTLTISSPGYFIPSEMHKDIDDIYVEPELILTMEEVLKLEKDIQEMKKYWSHLNE